MNEKQRKKLNYFKDLYETSLTAYADSVSEMEKNMRQYLGSDEIDGSFERAVAVRNITYEIIESIVSSDVPMPKADPESYTDARERVARSIERLCSSVRERLPFESMNDRDERNTYVFGGSVWYVEWDEELCTADEHGGVRVHSISPLDFIPQPDVYSVRDMDYCFIRTTATRGALMRKYSLRDEDFASCECEISDTGLDGSSYLVVIAFYKDECGEVGRLIFSGDKILADTPRYYERRFDADGKNPISHEIVELSEDGVKAAVPYYKPCGFPIVIRKNSGGESGLFGISDCAVIRPEQQAINKLESRILKKLILSGVTPVLPEDACVTTTNSVFGQLIRIKPGETLENYGKIDTTPDVSQDIAAAERLYEHARRIVGISDALVGLDGGKVESGYAKELKISRAQGRLESKRRLKYLAYSELYRLIFEHYLAFADEPRRLSYKDECGRIKNTEFNRHSLIESSECRGYHYFDGYMFSVDLNSGGEYQRETLWEHNLENLQSGTLGDKTSPSTLLRYWQSQERASYPFARENVEYFKSLVGRESDGST